MGLESEPGRGSCFYFSLPIAASSRKSRPIEDRHAATTGDPPKILIIEDDEITLQLIESQLTSAGYQVVCCGQADRALEVAANLQPQAITLDLLMKPTSGWEVLLQLKGDARTASIPVIVVTIVDNRMAGAAFGAEEYLVKPVDRATLLAAVERCIAARENSPLLRPILVVEDDLPTREIIVDLLTTKGYMVASATDGASALQHVATSLPELVILDLVLPDVSGFELLAEWRADARTAELPIFVLTSKDLSTQEKAYIRAHTQSFFHKQESWQEALLKQLHRAAGKPQPAKV